MSQDEADKKTIRKIIENYKNLEKSLVSQLCLETPGHHPTTGTYREAVWKSMFEQIIPRKFCIDQGVFIIDSYGKISAEVDLAIFDEQYTPYIFNYGKIKFIPIEAVAVVIQCKSRELDSKAANLEKWVDSIVKLKTSLASVARIITGLVNNNPEKTPSSKEKKSQTSTRPIRILCSTTNKNIPKKISNLFDISLSINDKDNTLKKTMPQEKNNYEWWYQELNHYGLERFGDDKKYHKDFIKESNPPVNKSFEVLKITEKDGQENVILSLIFQLNQMLMLINNPMLFPHEAYAEQFKTVGNELPDK
ncbi:DUF6602 domain-containing protein [Desulforamulus ruminis]|uniref:DUF6602 domain-containing protein n=1 Tax=Desulforamulus ruminis (strain ATCC 23193 / DSM 2154 / NCIMB 8452 / DL) TaxID=696281 RepID=F6DMG5_DESRL|nr:DUF6602 domain-containing protein [Desulforamulus ruminis]AEG61726.1 hypothetical protein Desru_3523 [Desulforamulus ruminis DSM 2154]